MYTGEENNVLVSLPAHSFEVVTMSLVLNYLPSPAHRELMIANARKLLISPCISPDEVSHLPFTNIAAAAPVTSTAGATDVPPIPLPDKPHLAGLLLIVEKISIFDWKANNSSQNRSHQRAEAPTPPTFSTTASAFASDADTTTGISATAAPSSVITPPSRHEWIRCICDMGFELVTYQTQVYAGHHVHLFAFRVVREAKTPSVEGKCENQDRARLRIKTDVKFYTSE